MILCCIHSALVLSSVEVTSYLLTKQAKQPECEFILTLKKTFLVAYLWNMAGKFVIQSLGILSTLVLVRLLSPEDFGIIAIAVMFIGLSAVLTDSGINRYLILLPNPTESDYDSAWTTNIVLRFFALTAAWLLAPSFATFMEIPEITTVVRVLALISFVETFTSIGMVKFQREMNFGPINRMAINAKIFAVVTTIVTAYYFRSYYALLAGTLVNSMIMLVQSYYFTKRPFSFVFSYNHDLLRFYLKLLLRNIVGYSRSQVDTLIVGKFFGNEAVGGYSIARQFAILPQTEIIGPAMQPNFSYLSSIKDKQVEFMDKAFQSLFLMYCFVIPSAFGLLHVAEPFVLVVLGEQWTEVIEYIGMLAFLMLPFCTQPLLHTVYDAKGKTGLSLFTDLFGLLLIIIVSLSFTMQATAEFVEYRVFVGIIALMFSIIMAKWLLAMSLTRFLLVLALPSALSFAMYLVLSHLSDELSFSNIYLDLIANAVFGAIIYCIALSLALTIIANVSIFRAYRNNIPIFIYSKFQFKSK